MGKGAADNDKLSIEPEHRDPDDWWLHASGCPGSHVVVRCDSFDGESLPREIELDAAVLAANCTQPPTLARRMALLLSCASRSEKALRCWPGIST